MDLEQKAIERVKTASEMSLRIYGRPLVVTDSGGKDSAVCREIVRRAGIPFELHHNLTTADAPQTIYYDGRYSGNMKARESHAAFTIRITKASGCPCGP